MHLWPLIEQMVSAGLSDHIALATDMAESEQLPFHRRGPGLGQPAQVRSASNFARGESLKTPENRCWAVILPAGLAGLN